MAKDKTIELIESHAKRMNKLSSEIGNDIKECKFYNLERKLDEIMAICHAFMELTDELYGGMVAEAITTEMNQKKKFEIGEMV